MKKDFRMELIESVRALHAHRQGETEAYKAFRTAYEGLSKKAYRRGRGNEQFELSLTIGSAPMLAALGIKTAPGVVGNHWAEDFVAIVEKALPAETPTEVASK